MTSITANKNTFSFRTHYKHIEELKTVTTVFLQKKITEEKFIGKITRVLVSFFSEKENMVVPVGYVLGEMTDLEYKLLVNYLKENDLTKFNLTQQVDIKTILEGRIFELTIAIDYNGMSLSLTKNKVDFSTTDIQRIDLLKKVIKNQEKLNISSSFDNRELYLLNEDGILLGEYTLKEDDNIVGFKKAKVNLLGINQSLEDILAGLYTIQTDLLFEFQV